MSSVCMASFVMNANIWGRRAKIKALAKKSLETGEDFDAIPESMRTYLAMQAMESGKGLGAGFLGRGLMPYGHGGGMAFGGEQNGQGKVCKSRPNTPKNSFPDLV